MKRRTLRRITWLAISAYHLLWLVPAILQAFGVIDWSAAAIFAPLWAPSLMFLAVMVVADLIRPLGDFLRRVDREQVRRLAERSAP